MQLREMNHRSPMRAFERSVKGGLARGSLGLVAGRAGVGKDAFLTGVALDHLLRGEKVLHVAAQQTVEHVRQRYEEIFADLARTANLEERALAREAMERNRIIRSFAGCGFVVDRFAGTLHTLRQFTAFFPDLIVLGGLDFEQAETPAQVAEVLALARQVDARLWMPVRVHRLEPGADWREIPAVIQRLDDLPAVVVRLEPQPHSVRIRLLKNRQEGPLPDLDLELDPTTLLVKSA
ncbi:MAG: hypothetical protein HY812_18425 [Planctomycetes bacterium]|nr:hypothetical protein [Planctomycetota bacterium]